MEVIILGKKEKYGNYLCKTHNQAISTAQELMGKGYKFEKNQKQ